MRYKGNIGVNMINKKEKNDFLNNDLGLILWELETYKNFLTYYKKLIK